MACEHSDCFTCPYDDCISDIGPMKERKKPGRKKLPPEELHKHRLAYNRKYNAEHKEKMGQYMKTYYQEHRAEYIERERLKRKKKIKVDNNI